MDFVLKNYILVKDFIIFLGATITIFLYFKNRRNSLREDIFKRQTDLLISITILIEELDEALCDFYDVKNEKYSGDIEELRIIVYDKYLELGRLIVKGSLLLPEKLYLQLHTFLMYISATKDKILKQDYDPYSSELSDKQFEIVEKMRTHIGIEKLSKETIGIIKSRIF